MIAARLSQSGRRLVIVSAIITVAIAAIIPTVAIAAIIPTVTVAAIISTVAVVAIISTVIPVFVSIFRRAGLPVTIPVFVIPIFVVGSASKLRYGYAAVPVVVC